MNFLSISNLIFTAGVACKTPVWFRPKIQFVELDSSNLIFDKYSTDQQEFGSTSIQV